MIVLTDDNTKVLPGHGNVSNRAELIAYKNMLVTLKNRVQQKIDNGKTAEEIKKDIEITKEYRGYSGWITEERIIETIYKSLTSK